METNLTKQDLEILTEGVELWLAEPSAMRGRVAMMSAMMADSKEEGLRRINDLQEEAGAEVAKRKDRAIMLMAKLVCLKDKKFADELSE